MASHLPQLPNAADDSASASSNLTEPDQPTTPPRTLLESQSDHSFVHPPTFHPRAHFQSLHVDTASTREGSDVPSSSHSEASTSRENRALVNTCAPPPVNTESLDCVPDLPSLGPFHTSASSSGVSGSLSNSSILPSSSDGSVRNSSISLAETDEEIVPPHFVKRKSTTDYELVSPGKRCRSGIDHHDISEPSRTSSSMILTCQSYVNHPNTQNYGHIPVSPHTTCSRRRPSSRTSPSPQLSAWLSEFHCWTSAEKTLALNALVSGCDAAHVRHLMAIIEPQFQRDFISLLPKELALYVLSFLPAPDLIRAAQTCQYWRQLANDPLLWREKCHESGADKSLLYHPEPHDYRILKQNADGSLSLDETKVNWRSLYIKANTIEKHWINGEALPSQILRGHDDHVITCLEFFGKYIVSGSDDNTLKVWDVITSRCIHTLVGHTGGVWSSQMNESVVISGSTDRTLRVWDVDEGVCLHTLNGHSSTVRCMSLYHNVVVSGSRDATLRVWNVENGQCEHILMGHVAAVRCVQFDGTKVVSGAYDFTVRIWDPFKESCLHVLNGHTNRVYSLQFDGRHIVSGSLDTSIRVWDVETGEALHTLIGHQSLTSGMELEDGVLVSGNADSTVKVWDIRTGKCLQTLTGHYKHSSAVTCLQFNRKFVITSSDDGTVKLWDLKTGRFIRNLVTLTSGGNGGVVWRLRATNSKLVCAAGSRNGTEETKLIVLDFGLKDDQRALIDAPLVEISSSEDELMELPVESPIARSSTSSQPLDSHSTTNFKQKNF